MLKYKIGFTVFVLYEILAIILLHFTGSCYGMFGIGFCSDVFFKYFLFCVAIPLIAMLIWMWIHEVIVHNRRRTLKYKAKHAMAHLASTFKHSFGGHHADFSKMEKYIAAALLIGAKKYADNHPKIKEFWDEITEHADNDQYDSDYDYDDEDDDSDDDNEQHSTQRSAATSKRGNSRSAKGRSQSTTSTRSKSNQSKSKKK